MTRIADFSTFYTLAGRAKQPFIPIHLQSWFELTHVHC